MAEQHVCSWDERQPLWDDTYIHTYTVYIYK